MSANEQRRSDSEHVDFPGPDRGGAICRVDDLKSYLQLLSSQIAEADKRNADTLRDMRERLERLGEKTLAVKSALPEPFAADLGRLEDGMTELVHQISAAGETRASAAATDWAEQRVPAADHAPVAGADLQPTGSGTAGDLATLSREPAVGSIQATSPDPPIVVQAMPVAARAATAIAPPALRSAVVGPMAAPVEKPKPVLAPGAHPLDDEPWDTDAAEALVKLYDSGEPDMAKLQPEPPAPLAPPHAGETRHAEAPAVVLSFAGPPAAATSPDPAIRSAEERVWLEERLADVAGRIERSLADLKPDSSFADLGRRFDQLEERWSTALTDVATRSDVEGLRLVEAHIAELSARVEQTQSNLARLDVIEAQLADLTGQLTDDRVVQLFGSLVPTEDDLSRYADNAAEKMAALMAQQAPREAPAAAPLSLAGPVLDEVRNASSQGIGALQAMLARFIDEQRQGEAQTSEALETIQQAMQHVLDRVEAIEAVRPTAQAQPMPAAFAPDVQTVIPPQPGTSPVPAHSQAPHAPSAVTLEAPGRDPFEQAKASAKAAAAAASTSTIVHNGPAKSYPSATGQGQRREPEHEAAGGVPDDIAAEVAAAVASRAQAARPAAAATAAGGNRSVIESARRAAAEQAKAELAVADASGKADKGGKGKAARGRAADPAGLNITRLLVPCMALFLAAGVSIWVLTKPKPRVVPQSAARMEQLQPESRVSPKPSSGPAIETDDDDKADKPATRSGEVEPGRRSAVAGSHEVDVASLLDGVPRLAQAGAPRVVSGGAGIMVQQPGREPTVEEVARAREQVHLATLSERTADNAASRAAARPTAIPVSLQQSDDPVPAEAGGAARSSLELPSAMVGPMSLRLAAAKGDASAQFEVAARFAEGKGVKQDFAQAATWYQRAAAQGLPAAQYRLAALFERGLGVKADPARARNWYLRSAEQGNVKAMHNLAVLSAGRDQGSADYPTAVQWFTEAAELGLSDSQYNLGVLHESGLGVPKNPVVAYKWYAIAAKGGDREAARRQQLLRSKLDAVALQQAEESIAGWQAKPTQPSANDAILAGTAWRTRATSSSN